MDAGGAEVRPLDAAALTDSLRKALAQGFTSAAIAFLHSDLDPAHERQAGDIARGLGFKFVALSHEVSPLPRFIPRAETTVADAYLTPILQDYVRRVADAVAGAPLFFMTSAGGLVRAEAFRGKDAVVSGPAGGVVGVARTADAASASAVLGFDMGGTSTDVCRFAGQLERRDTAKVAGVKLRSPMLDVETVAAGGGSILAFDGMRARAGPASAGADPGPAAYGREGPATVTDATWCWAGSIRASSPRCSGRRARAPWTPARPASAWPIWPKRWARRASKPRPTASSPSPSNRWPRPCAASPPSAASTPREHALTAFGGAAGQVACQTAESLGVSEILCPRYGSVLSAWGIGQAQVTALRQAGLEVALDAAGLARAEASLAEVEVSAKATMAEQGAEASSIRRTLRLRYDGADAELPVALADLDSARARFEEAHQRLFGFIEPARTILIAAVEVEAIAPPSPSRGGAGGGGASSDSADAAQTPPLPTLSPQGERALGCSPTANGHDAPGAGRRDPDHGRRPRPHRPAGHPDRPAPRLARDRRDRRPHPPHPHRRGDHPHYRRWTSPTRSPWSSSTAASWAWPRPWARRWNAPRIR